MENAHLKDVVNILRQIVLDAKADHPSKEHIEHLYNHLNILLQVVEFKPLYSLFKSLQKYFSFPLHLNEMAIEVLSRIIGEFARLSSGDFKNVNLQLPIYQELVEQLNHLCPLEIDPKTFDLFRLELENACRQMNEILLQWEQQPQDLQLMDQLMRIAHSVKGAARAISIPVIVKLAHAMEDYFSSIKQERVKMNSEKMDELLQAVDLMAQLIAVPYDFFAKWLDGHTAFIEFLAEQIGPSHEKMVLSDQKNLKNRENKKIDVPLKGKPKKLDKMKPFQTMFTHDRILRVTAQNLNRLIALAGESLVESRWLYPFANSLQELKKEQQESINLFEHLRESLNKQVFNIITQQLIQKFQKQLSHCEQLIVERLNELDGFIRRHASLSDRLYQEVINSRMRPFADGVEIFPRMVRDLAKQLGKQIHLQIEGITTPVDRDILEKLEAPLTHLLRNAVDHGIETPDKRQRLGKPTEGTIRLEAHHHGGMLSITVSDDGRGIHPEELRHYLIAKEFITAQEAEHLSHQELVDFLFLPGFTTVEKMNDISGRGIGLNVVQNMVQEVGGAVRVEFAPNQGMTFYLQLPLTLSVIRALLVEISGEAYAFPLARIEKVFLIPIEQVQRLENRPFFHYEGRNIGLISAWQVLELPAPPQVSPFLTIILLKSLNHSYGLIVDRFLAEKELVVQELNKILGKMVDITAGALLEDGSPVLIIDVEEILQSINQLLAEGQLEELTAIQEVSKISSSKKILVVDDSLTVREVEARLLQNQGYDVDTAINGLDAWNAIRLGHYDLIISDVDMPRMNGIELLRSIRHDPKFKSLPFMIVSYKESEEDKTLGLEAGADYYLIKSSFHDEKLLEAVKDLIGKPKG